MHLRKLSLTNFCQHRSMSVEFHPGVTGVLGSNGRGKSNLLKAARFALVKASGNVGVMAADLNWSAAAVSASGFVELDFEKGGTEGRVKRFVDKGKSSLRFGSTKANSAKAVDAAMADIITVPKRVIEEIVFVDQGAIERILFDKPAERAKQFQALFGTSSAEVIRGLLQKELAGLSDSPVDEQIARLQKQLDATIDPELRRLMGMSNQLVEAIKGFDEDTQRKVIAEFVAAEQLGQSISEAERQVTALAADVDAGKRVVAGLMSQAVELKAAVDGEKETIAETRGRISALDLLKRASAMRAQLAAAREEQHKVLSAQIPVAPSVTQDKVYEHRVNVGQARAELVPKQAFVKAFKGGQADATCPTCMQVVHNAAGLAQRFEGEIISQAERVARAEAVINKAEQALHTYNGAIKEDQVRRGLATRRLVEVEDQLNTLGASDYDPEEADALRAQLHAFEIKEDQLTKVEQLLQTKQVATATTRGTLTEWRSRLKEFSTQVVDAPTQTRHDEAKQALQGFDDAKTQKASIDGQLAQLRNQRAGILTELEQLQAEASKLENVHKYQRLCEQARTVLHRDCLPLVVTRSFLAALNALMAEYLQTFDVPFAAEIKDDLTVVCTFPGSGEQDAGRLSGGQKVMLGIGFRFAVYRLFAGELGFMVLDEPTAHLDPDKVRGIVDVLQAVRRYAWNTGMQVIVVTHEAELTPAFDHVVRL